MSADDMGPKSIPENDSSNTAAKAPWIAPRIDVFPAQAAENSPFVAGATFDGGIGYS